MAVLYDQFGREVRIGEAKRPETREISTVTIRDRWSTYPSRGLTPTRLAAIFKAADAGDVLRQAELFEEIEEKDPHIFSQFQTRKLAVQGLGWEIDPVGEDAQASKTADFCREALNALDLDEIFLDMLDALAKGYSMNEILWDASGNQAVIRDIRWIHPKKVTFWDSIHPRVLTEEEPVRGVDPQPFKWVYFRHKARSGYDTRAGIMRVCAWMYLFKNYGIKDWVIFTEVFGQPLRVGKYDQGASQADKDALLAAIQAIGTDAAGIISKNTEIEFVEAQQRTGSLNIYESLTRFCDNQTSKAILGQVLTSEAGGQKGEGSRALGEVHGEVRQDLIESDCSALGKTITNQVLRPLVGFNFGFDSPVPQFKFLYEPPEDTHMVAEVYHKIWSIGQPISQEHISERFKIPLPAEGETPLAPPSGRSGPIPAKLSTVLSKETGIDLGQAAIDEFVDRLAERGDVLDPVLKPVIDLVTKAESFEEIQAKLYDLAGEMDTERFEELLRQSLFAADLWGYLRSNEEQT